MTTMSRAFHILMPNSIGLIDGFPGPRTSVGLPRLDEEARHLFKVLPIRCYIGSLWVNARLAITVPRSPIGELFRGSAFTCLPNLYEASTEKSRIVR